MFNSVYVDRESGDLISGSILYFPGIKSENQPVLQSPLMSVVPVKLRVLVTLSPMCFRDSSPCFLLTDSRVQSSRSSRMALSPVFYKVSLYHLSGQAACTCCDCFSG